MVILEKSRTENSLKNVKITFIVYFITMFFQFINRTMFLKFLSIEYLGINGLFSNVLSMLNLAELGIGSAMVYEMYRPCAKNDIDTIKKIMYLYKKIYIIIGIFILIVGSLLTPFLNFFINTPPQNIGNIHYYYLLYVFNIAISYFFTYKRSLIICFQKQYISSITTCVKNVLVCFFQILILFLTKNYTLYLMIQIIFTFLENVVISRIANRMYPYLKDKATLPDSSIINSIKKNVFAMFFHKIGTVIVTGTDNLIITKFVSLTATGLYSNYLIVISALNNLISQIFSSLTASVGNLIVEKNNKQTYYVFKKVFFLNFMLFLFTSVVMNLIFNDFISLWVGEKYTFNNIVVFFISLHYFSGGMRKAVLTFKDAAGLFWNDRYKPIVESIANLIFSIPLTIKFGICGTLLGTIITNIFIAGLIEAYVLYKNCFKINVVHYLFSLIKYYILFFGCMLITIYIGESINFSFFSNIIVKSIVGCLITFVLICIFCFKTNEFKDVIRLIKNKMI